MLTHDHRLTEVYSSLDFPGRTTEAARQCRMSLMADQPIQPKPDAPFVPPLPQPPVPPRPLPAAEKKDTYVVLSAEINVSTTESLLATMATLVQQKVGTVHLLMSTAGGTSQAE